MPQRWRDCLQGKGDVDLRGVRLLSEHHYLWSPGNLISNLAGFFASKALRGRVDQVKGAELPPVFANPAFRGKVYRLAELVLDVPDVIRRLAELSGDSLAVASSAQVLRHDDGGVAGVRVGDTTIVAKRYVLTAGEGNEGLLQSWGVQQPAMQRRPLQMVLAKGRDLPALYAHCLGSSPKPRITVTTHPCADSQWCWYLGGELAEQGVSMTPDALIDRARAELKELLPWVRLDDCQWTTLPVNRAEPAQSGLVRPDTAYLQAVHNVLVSWPTKLALAPDLADQALAELRQQTVVPAIAQQAHGLPAPKIAAPVWDVAF